MHLTRNILSCYTLFNNNNKILFIFAIPASVLKQGAQAWMLPCINDLTALKYWTFHQYMYTKITTYITQCHKSFNSVVCECTMLKWTMFVQGLAYRLERLYWRLHRITTLAIKSHLLRAYYIQFHIFVNQT